MKRKLLTLSDLYSFYSGKKKSMTFSSEKSGYSIAVQTEAMFQVDESLSEGLLYGKVRAFHDLTNKNKSHIETDVLEEKMLSIKDRPVMADIVDTDEIDENGNPIKDFSGHTMFYDEDLDKMIYKEIPVGHFVNPENIHTEYDEKYDRNFVVSDVVVYEDYTDTCEILKRRGTVDCSVELCIRAMHWDNNDKTLHLDDFFVQGCTLLGSGVLPGMDGSKLSLKDFSEKNNSLFTSKSEENSKLIETLDKLNTTLSCLNINSNIPQENFEKGGSENNNMNKFEELLNKYNKTAEEITFEYEGLTDEELEAKFAEVFDQEDESAEGKEGQTPEVPVVEEKKGDENEPDDPDEPDDTSDDDDNDDDEKKFAKTFELSHEDIRSALYALLEPIEQAMNDWFWIVEVYDSHFICQSCTGKYYSQKYTKDNDTVALDGELVEVYAEFVTASEKEELDKMRANYSSIVDKLSKYEEEEDIADKMTIFSDEAYADFLETDEFKNLMSRETMKKFTKDELAGKADAAYGKLIRTTKTFAAVPTEPEKKPQEKKPMFYAFSKHEEKSSFLDGLLNSKN